MNLKNYYFVFITLHLVSCKGVGPQEIPDQNTIYGHYHARKSKGSEQVTGKVIFYRKNGKVTNDYIPLAQGSNVQFESAQMREIKDEWNQTSYENNFYSTRTRSSSQSVIFSYKDNNGNVFINRIGFPSFVKIHTRSININYKDKANSAKLQFNWQFFNTNKNLKSSNVEIELVTTNGIYLKKVTKNPASLTLKGENMYIKSIRICSTLTLKANGSSEFDKKTSRYCDERINI